MCQVNTIYQRCGETVSASCNCAVAVQSDDDVIIIDRCFRQRPPMTRPHSVTGRRYDAKNSTGNETGHVGGASSWATPPRLIVKLFLNGKLTPGTKVYRFEEGRKYFVSSICIASLDFSTFHITA